MKLKEVVRKQLEFCNAIAQDIIANEKSKEVQEYTQRFAEIESPLVGGTEAKWIRINWGDVYIFIHDDGSFWYHLDGLGEYGSELIEAGSVAEFLNKLEKITDEEILHHSYMEADEEDYSEYAPGEYIAYPGR